MSGPCPDLQELAEVALGEGQEPGSAARAHLSGCEPCRRRVERLDGLLDLPRSAEPPPAVLDAILAGIGAQVLGAAREVAPAGAAASAACPVCQVEVPRDEALFCGTCLAPHHPECFAKRHRCGAPGCAGRRPVGSRAPRRTGRRALLVLLCAGAGAGAIAAWQLRPPTPAEPARLRLPEPPPPAPPAGPDRAGPWRVGRPGIARVLWTRSLPRPGRPALAPEGPAWVQITDPLVGCQLVALDRETGRSQRHLPAEGDARACLVSHRGPLTFAGASLRCLDREGQLLWERRLPEGATGPLDGAPGEPVLAPDGRAVLVPTPAGLYSVELDAPGSITWRLDEVLAIGAPRFDGSGRILVPTAAGLVVVDAGERRASVLPLGPRRERRECLVAGDAVLVWSPGAHTIERLTLLPRGKRPTLDWTLELPAPVRGAALLGSDEVVLALGSGELLAFALGGERARELWRVPVGQGDLSPPTVVGQDIYLCGQGGLVHQVRRGGLHHRVPLEGTAPRLDLAPVVDAPTGRVYVSTPEAIVCVAPAEGAPPAAPPGVMTRTLLLEVQGLVLDVRVDGRSVPREARHVEPDGPGGVRRERLDVELGLGGFLALNLTHSDLRERGPAWVAVRGLDAAGRTTFVSDDDGTWWACNEPTWAGPFVLQRALGTPESTQVLWHPTPVAVPDADLVGRPLWGHGENVWLKRLMPR